MGFFFFFQLKNMAAKKNKGVKLNLNEFLSEDTSWAAASMDDEDDDITPTNDPYENDNEPTDNYRERNYEKHDRPRRNNDAPQKPIPDHGPWVAYVGNLPYNASDDDVGNFFAEHCDVIDVKIRVDHATGRNKGFGYVTFDNVESLREALGANDAEFLGRNIRVDVAEGQRDKPRREYREREKKVREPSRADTVDKWERGVKKPIVEKPLRDSNRNDRPRRDDRSRRDYNDKYQPKERKPITIQPRTSNDPIGAPAKTSKSNPFGDAKPRDELQFQKKKEEERQRRLREKEKEREKQQQSSPKFNSKYGRQNKNAWKGNKNTGGNRNFDNIRDNMGKTVTKAKEPKKYKPVQVRKEAASIP